MKKDIVQIITGTAVLCALMDIVFLLIGKFDLSVFWGTLIGFACATANFSLLAFTVSKSVSKGKAAGGYMGISYLLRLFIIGAVIVLAIKSEYINYVAVAIPLVFPRIIITVIQGIMNKKGKINIEESDTVGRT